jgi:DNA mismatch endonuclease (patch repair protein)
MARIRQRGTQPELVVRRALRALGLGFRNNRGELPGSPDLANKSRRWAVFVHGCYWHHHTNCSKATIPTRNREFWLAKFRRNRHKDAAATRRLRALGYRVVLIWECETASADRLARKLAPLQPQPQRERGPGTD